MNECYLHSLRLRFCAPLFPTSFFSPYPKIHAFPLPMVSLRWVYHQKARAPWIFHPSCTRGKRFVLKIGRPVALWYTCVLLELHVCQPSSSPTFTYPRSRRELRAE